MVAYKDVLSYIQVTLDGERKIHNKRRVFHDGSGSFDAIWQNIRLALEKQIEVYIRVNVDSDNLESLPALADLIEKDMLPSKHIHPYLYLLQDGGCAGDSKVLDEEHGIGNEQFKAGSFEGGLEINLGCPVDFLKLLHLLIPELIV